MSTSESPPRDHDQGSENETITEHTNACRILKLLQAFCLWPDRQSKSRPFAAFFKGRAIFNPVEGIRILGVCRVLRSKPMYVPKYGSVKDSPEQTFGVEVTEMHF